MAAAREYTARMGDAERRVVVEPLEQDRFRVTIDGQERIVDARRVDGGPWSLVVDGRTLLIDVEPAKDGDWAVEIRGTSAVVKLVDPRQQRLEQARAATQKARAAAGGGREDVRAPMPGKVVKVLVKVGDRVAAGQGLAVIEAMKMENELRAPRDAGVVAVHVAEAQAVEGQQPVVTLE